MVTTSAQDEVLWNHDLIEIIQKSLVNEFPKLKVRKSKVLKDLFLSKDKNKKYSLQFGFVDQDIIIYDEDEMMDISDFEKTRSIILHKAEDKTKLIVPKIICELKYNGVNSHGLITYSSYASDIKSIFPECKYYLLIRYQKSSSENKLFRHGRYFDKILCFEKGDKTPKYFKGAFIQEMKNNPSLTKVYDELIYDLKSYLRPNNSSFIK